MARDIEQMRRTLREHLVMGSSIAEIRPISTGHSNETYLLEGLDLVMRLPPSGPPLLKRALSVGSQFEAYAVLRGLDDALPVPAVRYLGTPDVLGDPFFLMERVKGVPWTDWGAPDWVLECDDDLRDSVCSQAVGALAALHRQAPLDVFGPIRSNATELGLWRETATGRMPADLENAFELLEDTMPKEGAPAPCHGDCKLANMLWQDGRLTALLDWELAFNGDPRWDLAYFLGPFGAPDRPCAPGYDGPGFWRRDRIVREWETAAGRKVQRLTWFDAAVKAKVASILAFGHDLFRRGLSEDERLGRWGEPAAAYSGLALKLARSDAAWV